MTKIVNVVALADLGVELDLAQLAQRFPDKTTWKPMDFAGLFVHLNNVQKPKATFFHTGKVTVAGAASPTAAKLFLRRCARELGLGRYVSFRVVNIVATWSTKYAINDTFHLVDPKAFIKISRHGRVYCSGVKSRADLRRVYKLTQ